MLLGLVRRYPIPLCYLAGLAVVSTVFGRLSPHSQDRFDQWASTNVANLTHRPLSTLIVSGFIAEDGVLPWLLLTGTGLFLLVHRFGNIRGATIVISGHVIGTLISEGIVAYKIHEGVLPDADRTISDVGPSYIAAAALVAVILYAPELWQRGIALSAWLVAILSWFDGLSSGDVAAVGHLVSMLTGALLGGLFLLLERVRRTHQTSAAAVQATEVEVKSPTVAGGPHGLPATSQL